MTWQEILEGITRHRAKPVEFDGIPIRADAVSRKFDEVEWALQAIVEKLRDDQPK